MYGVPEITNSRVPGTRPGRPSDGNRLRCATPDSTAARNPSAPCGLSFKMNVYALMRSLRARSSHLTCKFSQFSEGGLNLLVGREIAGVGFFNCLFDTLDLPFVYIH